MKKLLIPCLLMLLTVTSCTSINNSSQVIINDKLIQTRTTELAQFSHWQVKGKIAFIQQQNRESASLFWQVNEAKASQLLKLTTYLGINVLSLEQSKQQVSITVDGEKHHSDNIDQLIWQLTGLTLPTKAMHFWLKGLPFAEHDRIVFDAKGLPKTLTSFYQGRVWQINYQTFKQYQNVVLPNKLTVKQNDLTIKLAINQWSKL